MQQTDGSQKRPTPLFHRFTAATGAWVSLIVCVASYSLGHFMKVGVDSLLVCVFCVSLPSFLIFGFFALLGVHYRNEGRTPTGKVLTDYTLHVHGDDLLLVQKRIGDWYLFFNVAFLGLIAFGLFAGCISSLLQSVREPELKPILGFLGFGFFGVVASLFFFPIFFLRYCFLPWKRKILILNRDSVWVKYGKKSDIPDRIEALKAKPDNARLWEVLDGEVLQMLKRFEDPTERETVLEEIRMELQRVWDDSSDDADRARLARRKEEEEEFLEEVEDARLCLQILRQGRDPDAVGSSGSDEKEEIPRPTRRGLRPTTIAGILFAVFVVSVILGALKVEWMVSRWKGFAFWSFLFFASQVYEIVRERRYRMRENLSLLDLIIEDYTLSTQGNRVILVRKYLRGLGFTVARMFPVGLVCLGFGSLLGFMTWFIYGTRPLDGSTAFIFPILAIMWLMWGKVCKGLLFSLPDLPFRRRILILSRDALSVKKGGASNLPERLKEIEAQPEVVLPDRPAPWDRNLLILQKLCENPQDRQTILEELRRRLEDNQIQQD